MNRLNKDFFSFDPEIVAKNLLWKFIVVWDKRWVIIETETYKWNNDEASHAFWWKTKRNLLMYETYWFVYVYLIYWIHYCLNFTADKDNAGAVLVRWIFEYKETFKNIKNNKEFWNKWKIIEWPWRTTKFLWIDKTFNWLDLSITEKIKVFDIWLTFNYKQTSRIWIKKALDKKWRFVIKR